MPHGIRRFGVTPALWFSLFETTCSRMSSKIAYYATAAIIFLPFVLLGKILRFEYAQSVSLRGYDTRGSLPDLELFEKGKKIAQVFKALMSHSLVRNVSYKLFRAGFIKQMIDIIRFSPNSILEVGSGASINLHYLKRRYALSESIGLDFATKRIKEAKSFWDERAVPLSYVRGDAAYLPFRDDSIQVVFSSHCLEQMSQNRKYELAIREMHRVTSKLFILMEPGFELGNIAQKFYMELRGYSKYILSTVRKCGFRIRGYYLLGTVSNALNPTMMIVIAKNNRTR